MSKSVRFFLKALKNKFVIEKDKFYLKNELKKIDELDEITLLKKSNLFDYKYYAEKNNLTTFSEDEIVNHFLNKKNDFQFSPQPLFDCEFYIKRNGLINFNSNPFIHYLRKGFLEGYETHPFFSMKNYLADISWRYVRDGNPLHHYIYNQSPKKILYNLMFDKGIYLISFPECLNDKKNPFYHYIHTGFNKVDLPVRASLDKKTKDLLYSAKFDAATRSYFFNYNPYFNNDPIAGSFSSSATVLEKKFSINSKSINSNISLFENCGIISRYPVLFDDQLNAYLDNSFRNETLDLINQEQINKLTTDLTNLGQFVISEAFYFFSGENKSYFDWFTEFIPVVLYIEKQNDLKKTPIIIENDLNSALIESLLLILSPSRPLIYVYRNKFYKVSKLFYVFNSDSVVESLNKYYKNITVLKEVSEKIKKKFPNILINPFRKIFLCENETSFDFIKNYEVLSRYVKEQDLEIKNVNQLSFVEKVYLYNEAESVMLFLSDYCLDMIFMQQKTKLKIFYLEKEDPKLKFYSLLASEFKLDVDFIPLS